MRSLVFAWGEAYPEDLVHLAVRGPAEEVRTEAPFVRSVHSLKARPHALSIMAELSSCAKRVGADVVVTQNFTPLFPGKIPTVTLIHDVLFVEHKDWFTRRERLYFSTILLSARRASSVVGTSRTESARIQRHLDGRDVTPIGLAIPGELRDATPERPHGAPDTFMLAVARFNARKNLVRLLQAARKCNTIDPESPLVIVGQADGAQERDAHLLHDAVGEGWVVLMPRVSSSELKWLYSHCRGFVFPSLGEGFGLPPLEALAHGAPVAASDLPVLREVLGASADFFDPRNVDDIAAALDRLGLPSENRPVLAEIPSWIHVVERLRGTCTLVSRAR